MSLVSSATSVRVAEEERICALNLIFKQGYATNSSIDAVTVHSVTVQTQDEFELSWKSFGAFLFTQKIGKRWVYCLNNLETKQVFCYETIPCMVCERSTHPESNCCPADDGYDSDY